MAGIRRYMAVQYPAPSQEEAGDVIEVVPGVGE